MPDDGSTCLACAQPAIIRYRLLPHRHLAVSKVWAPSPRWVGSCGQQACRVKALGLGTVMKTESLGDEMVERTVEP